MTDIETLRQSMARESPPATLDLALQALWWAGKGAWDQAHGCAQQQEGDFACDWVHAYLHRVEGDDTNAAYWYRRAKQPIATGPLAPEWDAIANALLTRFSEAKA